MSLRSFLLLCLASSSLASLAAAKPNIIFILADDLGYADLSCYGADKIKTPHLDRMATEGVKFTDCYATDCYATGCVCSPTRGSLNREGLPSAIREGNWKLHLVAPVMKWAGKLPPEALLDKLQQEPLPWLFDLASDIGETRNVAAQHPEVVAKLRADLGQTDATLTREARPIFKKGR